MVRNNFYYMSYSYQDLVAVPYYSVEHITGDGMPYYDKKELVGYLIMLKDESGYLYEDGNLEKLNDKIFTDNFIYEGTNIPLSEIAIGRFSPFLKIEQIAKIAEQLNPDILGKKYRIKISYYS